VSDVRRAASLALVAGLVVLSRRPALAFSVLAHQAVVDAAWTSSIVPDLRRRFPGATADDLDRARAFAYGGAHVADLGYFPFGSRLFTDLVHYVRTGDFVASLLRQAGTIDERAFALGALSHWVTDDVGHPQATNRVVPMLYPKLRARYGDVITYADDHRSHAETEFRFDVLQLSRSKQSPDLFRHAIEFQVATPLLDRAFRETYGLGLDDVFASTDVAITTYRWAFREVIQEATGIAWQLYRADATRVDPTATAETFVGRLSRADFEHEFGDAYRQAGYFARFAAWVVKLVPKVGPLKGLPYQPLPPAARERFTTTFDRAVVRFRDAVAAASRGAEAPPDENLDTGRPSRGGDYPPADTAYTELVEKLAAHDDAATPAALRVDLDRHYAAAWAARRDPSDEAWWRADRALARIRSAPRID